MYTEVKFFRYKLMLNGQRFVQCHSFWRFALLFFNFIFLVQLCTAQERKLEKLLDQASEYSDLHQHREAIQYGRLALRQSEKLHNVGGIVKSYYAVAVSLKALERYQESLNLLHAIEKCYPKYLSTDIETSANMKGLLGQNYLSLGFNRQAYQMFTEMAALSQNFDNPVKRNTLLFRNYLFLKASHQVAGRDDSARYYLRLAQALAKNVPPEEEPVFYYSAANYHIARSGKLDSATYYNAIGRKLDRENPSKYLYMGILQTVNILYKQKMYQQSLDTSLQYLPGIQQQERLYYRARLSALIAQNYKAIGHTAAYAQYLDIAHRQEDSLAAMKRLAVQTASDIISESKLVSSANWYKTNIYILLAIISVLITASMVFAIHIKRKRTIWKQQQNQVSFLTDQMSTDKLKIIVDLAAKNSPEFLYRFSEMYPNFADSLLMINPQLQTSELIFCAYLKLNLPTKTIATYLFVTPSAVQNRKNRLRKKLNIPSDKDIYFWMNEVGV